MQDSNSEDIARRVVELLAEQGLLGLVRPRRLLKVAEVAERLSLNPSTVYRWIEAGRIRGVKIGGALRVEERDLEKLIDRAKR